ncbi:MAG: hypothetical protein QOD12_247 [Verrucomicrobiota bacterium]|jgi:hypothetical protein
MARPALLRSPAVIHFRFLGTALALSAIVGTLVHAQLTDEEKKKRDARSKAREEMRAIASPTPSETPEPTAKPKPADRKSKAKKHSSPKSKATPTPALKARKSPTPESNESPSPKAKEKSAAKQSTDEEDEEATPKPKASEKKTESPEPAKTPVLKKKPTPEPEESPTPRKKKTGAKKETTPTPRPTPKPEPSKSPTPAEKSKPAAVEPERAPSPTPRPPPAPPQTPPSDITVEKSGLEKEQGFEPPPPPPPRSGFWPWSRKVINYRYLTSATIDAIRRAPVQRARWKFVIVHNSGTRQGNARAFDYYHRRIRRMKNGLAYHFVIGNGTSSRNGQIEIGERWTRQMRGGHVHSDYMNNIGLGICLVGDFNRDQPTRAQLEACEELIRYLRTRCGKADGAEMAVRPHREVNPPRWATDCPGNVFPYPWFGRFR